MNNPAKELRQPAHFRPVDQQDERDIADDALVGDADKDTVCLYEPHHADHANLVPVPRANATKHLRHRFVHHVILLSHDCGLLLVGANYGLAAHGLVEKAEDGRP